jgi:hypothetical protein
MKQRRRAGLALAWVIPVLLLLLVLSPSAFGANKKTRRHRTPTPTHTVAPSASTGPATASSPSQGGIQFSVSGDVDVPKGATVADVLVVRGNVTVEGTVDGDIFVVVGTVTVAGHVSGSVIAVKGPIMLKSAAAVSGDVMSGGSVAQATGSRVLGSVKPNYSFTLNGFFGKLGELLVGLMILFSTALLGFAMVYLAPASADRMVKLAKADPLKSAFFGVVTAVGLPVIAGLTAATVVGVPLGLAIALALIPLFLVGFTWTIWIAGRSVLGPPRSRALAFGGGLAVTAAISLIPNLNLAVWTLGSVFGVGSMVRSFWLGRHGEVEEREEPAAGARPARPAARPGVRPAAAVSAQNEAGVPVEEAGAPQPGDIPGLAPRPRPAPRPAAEPGDVPGLAPRPRPARPVPAAETGDVPGLAPRPKRAAQASPASPAPGVAPPRKAIPRPARQAEERGPVLPPPPPMPVVEDESDEAGPVEDE